MNAPEEVWKPVVGYEGSYECSNLGRVRLAKATRLNESGHLLSIVTAKNGEPVVNLGLGRKWRQFGVGTLVTQAFGSSLGVQINQRDASLSEEEWRPIPGFEALYAASNLGRIKRLVATGRGATHPGKVLRSVVKPTGYAVVCLRRDGKNCHRTVHSLVALAFLGPRPAGEQVNHLNGQKADNRAKNLEYVTCQENHLHRSRVLGSGRGEDNGSAKLTREKVTEIRKLWQSGSYSQQALANQSGVAQPTISKIVRGVIWL